MKLGLDLELDFDFQTDVGVELDGLALLGEVKLDLELDFIVENRNRGPNRARLQKTALCMVTRSPYAYGSMESARFGVFSW